MVALSGRGWRLAPALAVLMAETDRLFPARSTASDGSIGDTAHSARTSDHNPDEGWVDAVDITDDDAHGCDVGLLAHHLVASRDRRVSYLIHKGTIWRGYDKPGLPAFTPQVYTGPNAHAHHLHVSIADAARFETGPWWPQSQPKPKPTPVVPITLPKGDDMLLVRKEDPNKALLFLGGSLFKAHGGAAVSQQKVVIGGDVWDAVIKKFGPVLG